MKNKPFSIPMNYKEFNANDWLKALRGRKYKQGHIHLLDDKGKFCCLGIACKIAGMEDDKIIDRDFLLKKFPVPYELTGDQNLPMILAELNDGSFLEVVGLDSIKAYAKEKGIVFRKGIAKKISKQKRLSFKEIADFIEDNVSFT